MLQLMVASIYHDRSLLAVCGKNRSLAVAALYRAVHVGKWIFGLLPRAGGAAPRYRSARQCVAILGSPYSELSKEIDGEKKNEHACRPIV